MLDGSTRFTVAARTAGGAPLPLDVPECPEFAARADLLRAVVHLAVTQVALECFSYGHMPFDTSAA